MGMPFQGKGLSGYDATKGAYAGVWVDSSGGPLSYFANGHFSEDGTRFTALVEGAGMDGEPARYEYLTTFSGARTRTFEIFQLDGDQREI